MFYYKKQVFGLVLFFQEILVDKIEEYVVIKDFDSGKVKESFYEKVELFWFFDFCCNGVEIIDFLGLNENEVCQ